MIISAQKLIEISDDELIAQVQRHYQQTGGFDVTPEQANAWAEEIRIIRISMACLPQPTLAAWSVAFEYKLPRIPRWLDAVILTRHRIIVLEFKVGCSEILSAHRSQLQDYVADLHDYHRASRGWDVQGILIPTLLRSVPADHLPLQSDIVVKTANGLPAFLSEVWISEENRTSVLLDSEAWYASDFAPAPSIVLAAKDMFEASRRADSDTDIVSLRALHYADSEKSKIQALTEYLVRTVQGAQERKERHIVFITGVPGSGKTLAGLSVVFHPDLRSESANNPVFLSGNVPLVRVLQDAITHDLKKLTDDQYRRALRGTVQSVHTYIDLYAIARAGDMVLDGLEHVVIFDEAQRAWNEAQIRGQKTSKTRRRSGSPVSNPEVLASEPVLMLRILERVPEWSVLVALVGNGQEIWKGEAGLPAWGEALSKSNAPWTVHCPWAFLHGAGSNTPALFQSQPDAPHLSIVSDEQTRLLHLDSSLRSIRSLTHNQWVEAVLRQDHEVASDLRRTHDRFELFITHSLEDAKAYLRQRAGDGETIGLLASFDAQLLRRVGIELSTAFRRNIPYAKWFNRGKKNAFSCRHLEIAASQIECQGLDLDHTIVIWGDDFLPKPEGRAWCHRKAVGGEMQRDHQEESQRNRLNGYRVLLTRARRSMILVVPPAPNPYIKGCSELGVGLRAIYLLLQCCGVQSLPIPRQI
jgi:hypothetical protein